MEKLTYLERLARLGINSAHPGGLKLTRKLLQQEHISPETLLIDVGCGTGQTAVHLGTHYHCKIVAVDHNPKMLELAQKKIARFPLANIELHCANVMDLPFRKNTFDIVLSESVTIFTEIRRALHEYYRILKPGGIFLAIEGTALYPLNASEMVDLQSTLGITYLPTQTAWCKLFKEAGFTDYQVLSQEPMKAGRFTSPLLNWIFRDYNSLMFRYRNKMQYGVYRCRK